MASIEEKILEIIRDNFEVPSERMSRDLSLREDLGADELDLVEIIIEIEDTFGIDVTEDDAEKFDTVGKIIDYVESEVKKQNAG